MAKVERTANINASADAVWELIGNFADLGWYPGNSGTDTETVDGKMQRSVALPGGAKLVEQQEEDGGKHSYSYSIVSGPLPVTNYQCTLRVEPEGDGCIAIWMSSFEPAGVSEDQAIGIISGVYEAGLKSLKNRF